MAAEKRTMTCMTCGKTKQWPDGFPDTLYATCWDCAWKAHLRDKHPKIIRKARREAERRARDKFRREAAREVQALLTIQGFLTYSGKQAPPSPPQPGTTEKVATASHSTGEAAQRLTQPFSVSFNRSDCALCGHPGSKHDASEGRCAGILVEGRQCACPGYRYAPEARTVIIPRKDGNS